MSRWVGGGDTFATSATPGWSGTVVVDGLAHDQLGAVLDYLKESAPLYDRNAKRIRVTFARATKTGKLYASARVTDRG